MGSVVSPAAGDAETAPHAVVLARWVNVIGSLLGDARSSANGLLRASGMPPDHPGRLGGLVRVTGLMTETTYSTPARPKHAAWFRAVAIAEAISWTGLLIGMLFKYVLSDNEIGVKIFGPIHGSDLHRLRDHGRRSSAGRCAGPGRPRWLALAASIPPLFTWFFELWADRTGRLTR